MTETKCKLVVNINKRHVDYDVQIILWFPH